MTAASSHISLPVPRAADASVDVARLAALLVCIIGEVVLAMWLEIIPSDVMPSLVGMTPTAALGVIVAALGLLCLTLRRLRPVARLIGLFLVLMGLLIFSQDLIGYRLGIDEALVPPGDAPKQLTRTAPGVTGSLILFGLGLLYAKRRPTLSLFSQIVALAMLVQVLIVVAGQAYGVMPQDDSFPFMRLSAYGAISAALLAFGLIAASPEHGIASAIIEPSPAGEMLRRLLPGILVVPLVIGWFARQAEVQSLYDGAVTLTIFVVANIVVLALFAWATIGAVRRADGDRQVALVDLRGQRCSPPRRW